MTRPGDVQKYPKKQPKLKVIIHAFGFSQGPSSERNGMLSLGEWDVIGKELCGVEQICECLYVHFETILGFT